MTVWLAGSGDDGHELIDKRGDRFVGLSGEDFAVCTSRRREDLHHFCRRTVESAFLWIATDIGGLPDCELGLLRVHLSFEGGKARCIEFLDNGDDAGQGGLDGFVAFLQHPFGGDGSVVEILQLANIGDLR